jgi:YHS domain-containing protein/thiol-disulfide isomerase/thioredoxin
MRLYRPLLLTLVLGNALAPPAIAQPVGVNWQADIEGAKTLARQTNRLVLIHFWTPNCGPCMTLDDNVFNQPGVGTALEAQFVPVKLNANENPATATGFGITRVPTDIIITPDGQVVGQLISPPAPSAFVAEVSQVASRHLTRAGQAFAHAAAAAPQPSAPPHMNSAYANLPIAANTPAAALAATTVNASQGSAATSGTSGFTPPPLGMPPITHNSQSQAAGIRGQLQPPADRYVMNTASSEVSSTIAPGGPIAAPPLKPAPPAAVANRYATPPSIEPPTVPTAAAAQTANQFVNPYAGTSPAGAAPVATTVPAIGGPLVGPQSRPSQSPVTPTASTTPKAGPPDVSKLPPGAPPLGFEGYCPVSMRNKWKWIAGDPRWGIVHRGRTYWFAGQQEQQQFWANADHYSPALSGIDPVLAIDHQQQVPGRREHSLDYDNLFYLFSSEATLQQFAASPERYATSVRQAMGIQRGRIVR